MRIAVIGAGRVGATLGTRWSEAGHHVMYGVRDPDDSKYDGLEVDAVPEAADGADVILLAVPWRAARDAATDLGDVADRVVIDATNPLTPEREHDRHPELSGAERIRTWLQGGRLVKAFNTTGSGNMADSTYPAGTPVMFVAGDDGGAKTCAMDLAADIGFYPVDAGALVAARDLEHLATLWIRLAYGLGHGPDIAFSLLSR